MLWDISDHFPILFCIDLRPSKSRNQLSMTSRLIYEKTITCFGESSISYDWSEILLHCSNINDSSSAYETFTRNYTMLYEKSFPIHENKRRNSGKIRQPWMTSGLLKSCNQSLAFTWNTLNLRVIATELILIDIGIHLKNLEMRQKDFCNANTVWLKPGR